MLPLMKIAKRGEEGKSASNSDYNIQFLTSVHPPSFQGLSLKFKMQARTVD